MIAPDHATLQAVQQQLIVSEARLLSLTRLSSNWYWQQDTELRFVDTTSRSNDRGGLTPQQHLGLCRWELPHTEPVGATWQDHRAALEARQPFHDLLLRRSAPGVRTHYVEVSGAPISAPTAPLPAITASRAMSPSASTPKRRCATPNKRPTRPAPPSRASWPT